MEEMFLTINTLCVIGQATLKTTLKNILLDVDVFNGLQRHADFMDDSDTCVWKGLTFAGP